MNNLQNIYNEFLAYLDAEDKEKSVSYILSKLDSGEIDIVTLYTDVLAPSLNNMFCKIDEKDICVWKEHIRSSIIRTIIECCYPYVIKERNNKFEASKGEKVIIVCPSQEYHEIGARMGADFFTLCGFDSVFVGSNTPQKDLLDAINIVKPKYIVISISNFYNIVTAKKSIDIIKNINKDVKIIASGYAFKEHPDSYKKSGADMFIDTFDDISKLK